MEGEVIPILRKQAGFLDEITFLYPSGKEVHAFSLWETAQHAGGLQPWNVSRSDQDPGVRS